ncbi:MAG: hypothetical protein R3C59_09165 [Planctomycetaceae bacterium]
MSGQSPSLEMPPPFVTDRRVDDVPDDEVVRHGNRQTTDLPIGPGEFPGIRKPFRSLWWLFHVLLGIGFLLPLMAGLAAFPGLSLLSLGFMLDAEARVGTSGRFRDGFPLLAISTRVGTIALMVFLFLLPIMGLSSVAGAQAVITELSGLPQGGLRILTVVLQVLVFIHLLLAIANGGSFGAFLSPLVLLVRLPLHSLAVVTRRRNLFEFPYAAGNLHHVISKIRAGTFFSTIDFRADQLLQIFRPWHHLKLAFKAAIGALCWLAVPTLLLGAASTVPAQNPGPRVLLSLIGGALMVPVAAWLPLLQCHQAVTGRFRDIFAVRTARGIISQVPLRWALATILMYGLAVPLYLSKVVLPPADAFWLFTPLFIVVIFPTRLLMGWVYGTGLRKTTDARRILRWPTKLIMIPMLLLYSGILFVLPLISEAGPRAMFENHAFLLPVPSGQFQQ